MILVTGATGNVGSLVIDELSTAGAPVRAFVRDPDKARERLGEVEFAVGDFSEPQSVRSACEGVDGVFLACANQPDQLTYETNAIDAAKEAGVPRVVKLSALGAEAGSELAFWDWHGRIEDHLRDSGVPAAVLRPSFYMSNLLESAEEVKRSGRISAPAGEARIAMIDPRDVAAVAAALLTGRANGEGPHVLTGPEAITYRRVAAQLSEVAGRDVEFVDISDDDAKETFIAVGLPPFVAESLVTLFSLLREGAGDQTTDTVEKLTGRPPRSVAEFARENASLFSD